MSIATHWASPPLDLRDSLTPEVTHVWRVLLDDSPERASRFRLHLSDDECDRADRCRTPHPQYQFVITRSILRLLLSRYLELLPTQIHFETQPQGKLILLTPTSIPIQFNVSHTRGMALIAFAHHHVVGIDVERIDRAIQNLDIAERYFSARESEHLASLPAPERAHHFFSYWTCKEAYLKMQGRGIAEGLARCEMAFDSERSEVQLLDLDQQGMGKDCSLYRMNVGAEHIGAIAISTSSTQISHWNWEDEYLS